MVSTRYASAHTAQASGLSLEPCQLGHRIRRFVRQSALTRGLPLRPLHSSARITKDFILITIRFPLRHLVLAAAASLLCSTAALAATAKRGALNNALDQYQQNALRRCDVHQGQDRTACVARILGEGNIESGVAGGGILRKSVTVTPGQ